MSIPFRPLALTLLVISFSAIVLGRAQAGGGNFYTPVNDPVVKEECGSCHMTYSPAMLPASSWKSMMGNLQNHFGADASIDANTAKTIEAYLVANAADTGGRNYGGKLLRGVSLSQAPLRITELPGWINKHREVAAWEWRQKDVRSKSNCSACHADAARGYYNE
jgi:nitrate/TMAO reductase-like tetraheme cytochrome c subunit